MFFNNVSHCQDCILLTMLLFYCWQNFCASCVDKSWRRVSEWVGFEEEEMASVTPTKFDSYLVFWHLLCTLEANVNRISLDEVRSKISVRRNVTVQLRRTISEIALTAKLRPLFGVDINDFHDWICEADKTSIINESYFNSGNCMSKLHCTFSLSI